MKGVDDARSARPVKGTRRGFRVGFEWDSVLLLQGDASGGGGQNGHGAHTQDGGAAGGGGPELAGAHLFSLIGGSNIGRDIILLHAVSLSAVLRQHSFFV